MKINELKTKNMIFNFSKNYQFTTRLTLKGSNIDTVDKVKLLGTIVTNDLKWNENTNFLVTKANQRMMILRKAVNFGASKEDLKQIYTSFIRSIVEQSTSVWNSSLSNKNIEDIERIQKSALKLILRQRYKTYENALNIMELESLKDRREYLNLKFAKSCIKNEKMQQYFRPVEKIHNMMTRNKSKFEVFKAKRKRLQNSPIIHMQRILNEDYRKQLKN